MISLLLSSSLGLLGLFFLFEIFVVIKLFIVVITFIVVLVIVILVVFEFFTIVQGSFVTILILQIEIFQVGETMINLYVRFVDFFTIVFDLSNWILLEVHFTQVLKWFQAEHGVQVFNLVITEEELGQIFEFGEGTKRRSIGQSELEKSYLFLLKSMAAN